VVRAQVEGYCCDAGKVILYVGIEEKGARTFEYRAEPDQEISLPEEILSVYAEFGAALERASRENDTAEDLSKGHSLMNNLECRTQQERMVGLAEIHEDVLRKVLRDGVDPEQRTVAAYVIGYVPKKKTVVNDLQYALRDPDESVRLNAVRALKAIALFGMRDPEQEIHVQPTWFIEMLNSVALSDRLEGVRALLNYTDKPDEHVISNIRDRALPALLEMARWQYLPHALPAYLLLGRVTGHTDQEMQDAWTRGERDQMVETIRKGLKK
jgi:hypothetical protein